MSRIWKLWRRDDDERASAAHDPGLLLGLSAPRFQDLGVLGAGSFAEVSLVEDRWLSRQVARKTLHADADVSTQRNFLDEARRLADLDHPGVPSILDLGVDAEGRPFCLLHYVAGRTLSRWIEERWPRAAEAWPDYLRDVGRIAAAICDVLGHAHERGYLHADLKPDNIMLGEHGEVFVIDWGVPSREGRVLGGRGSPMIATPAYMAPEQATGDPRGLDARTDVFLLGATLYHALMGRPPYRGQDLAQLIQRARAAEMPPLVIPDASATARGLEAIVGRCLRKASADRYPRVALVRAEL